MFLPDNQSNQLPTTKHYLTSFTIKFLREHSFTDSTGGLEALPPQDYLGQCKWHNCHGRITIDACSTLTSTYDNHKKIRYNTYTAANVLRLLGLGVLPCPLACGALFDGGTSGSPRPLDAHIVRGTCRTRGFSCCFPGA